MATVKDSVPHVVRTAGDQRQRALYTATIGRIEQVNSKIRLIRLYLDTNTPPVRHLPGQYVDLHIPEEPRVGGFTITSPPQTAMRLPAPTPSTTNPPAAATFDDPYIELAIQDSPSNPPAAYLWKAPPDIMNAPVRFRIGGNFTYPPLTLERKEFEAVDNVVFVAGGVGVNPIMSMVTAMDLQGAGKLGGMPKRVTILYSSKRTLDKTGKAEEVLFEHRLKAIAKKWAGKTKEADLQYRFFETSGEKSSETSEQENTSLDNFEYLTRRITRQDLLEALGPEGKRGNTLAYVCGLPDMTDGFVDVLKTAPGMDERRVLCEKWW